MDRYVLKYSLEVTDSSDSTTHFNLPPGRVVLAPFRMITLRSRCSCQRTNPKRVSMKTCTYVLPRTPICYRTPVVALWGGGVRNINKFVRDRPHGAMSKVVVILKGGMITRVYTLREIRASLVDSIQDFVHQKTEKIPAGSGGKEVPIMMRTSIRKSGIEHSHTTCGSEKSLSYV